MNITEEYLKQISLYFCWKCKWRHELDHLQHSKINPLAELLCWRSDKPRRLAMICILIIPKWPGRKELWRVASRRLSSEPSLAAGLRRALRAVLLHALVHARSGLLCFITTQPLLLQPLSCLSQHCSHVLTGPSCGFSVCVCWFRVSHSAKITKSSFQKQGLQGHQVNPFKQRNGFHILCKQRGPLGADATHMAWFLYFHLLVLKNKSSSVGHSYINNGRDPQR